MRVLPSSVRIDNHEWVSAVQRTANSLRRLLESVGIERRARDITPSLGEYLAAAIDQDSE
jgi:hypothetical protein